jgi:para-nitrobenzyl esterase
VVQTDWWMRIPALRLADARANAPSGTYMSEFAWPSPVFGGRLGAVHALEIPFVFDTLNKDLPLLGQFLGPEPPQELADTMHAAWVSFATSGDPGWPNCDLSRRATMRFNTTSQVLDDPRSRNGPCGKASARLQEAFYGESCRDVDVVVASG